MFSTHNIKFINDYCILDYNYRYFLHFLHKYFVIWLWLRELSRQAVQLPFSYIYEILLSKIYLNPLGLMPKANCQFQLRSRGAALGACQKGNPEKSHASKSCLFSPNSLGVTPVFIAFLRLTPHALSNARGKRRKKYNSLHFLDIPIFVSIGSIMCCWSCSRNTPHIAEQQRDIPHENGLMQIICLTSRTQLT